MVITSKGGMNPGDEKKPQFMNREDLIKRVEELEASAPRLEACDDGLWIHFNDEPSGNSVSVNLSLSGGRRGIIRKTIHLIWQDMRKRQGD